MVSQFHSFPQIYNKKAIAANDFPSFLSANGFTVAFVYKNNGIIEIICRVSLFSSTFAASIINLR